MPSVALYAGTVDLPKAAASAREALALLENVPDADPGLVAAALSARVRADLFLGNGFDRETAMRALALEEKQPTPQVDTRVVFKLGQWLRYIDDLDGARAQLERGGTAGSRGGRRVFAGQHPAQSRDRRDLGREYAGAAELAERMVDAFGQQGVGPGGRCSGARMWTPMPDGSSQCARPLRRQIRESRWTPSGAVPGTGGARGRRYRLRRQAPDGGARDLRPRRLPRTGDLADRRRRDRSSARRRRPRSRAASEDHPLRGVRGALAHPVEPCRLGAMPRSGARRAGRARRGRGWLSSDRSPSTSAARCPSSAHARFSYRAGCSGD